jgi:Flp pilus assembly protein TadD
VASGDIAAAIAQLRQAADISPHFPEAQYQLGLALDRSSRDFADIERTFTRVLELDPNHARARYRLGLLLARRGDTATAALELQRASAIAPGLVDAHRELARLALAAQDWSAAVRQLQTVLIWEPEDERARDDLSRARASVK